MGVLAASKAGGPTGDPRALGQPGFLVPTCRPRRAGAGWDAFGPHLGGGQSVSPAVGISIEAWGDARSPVRAGVEVTVDGSDSLGFLSLSKKRM